MAPSPVLYLSSANLLYLLGLHDVVSGAFVTAATVTVQLQDELQNNVGSPITLTNVPGPLTVNGLTYADGNYRGVVPANSLPLTAGSYNALVTATYQGVTMTKLSPVSVQWDV